MQNSDSKFFTGKLSNISQDKEEGKIANNTIWRVNYEAAYPIDSLPDDIRALVESFPDHDPVADSWITERSTVDVLSTEDAQDAITKVKEFIRTIDELKDIPELKIIIRGVKELAEADLY